MSSAIKNLLTIPAEFFRKLSELSMLDHHTIITCKDNPTIRDIKIKNIEHAIDQAEMMIKESKMSQEELIFLKKKISDSRQDLEILYLMNI